MVDIELEGPECIMGYKPAIHESSIELDAGPHDVPVLFKLTVPEGQRYRVNLHIEVTGVI